MLSAMTDRMKVLVIVFVVGLFSGCQTDSEGNRETAWEALKRWDDSMVNTENRLQDKNYGH